MIKVGRVGHPRASKCVLGAIYVVLAAKEHEFLGCEIFLLLPYGLAEETDIGARFQTVMVSLDGTYMSENLFLLSLSLETCFLSQVIWDIFPEASLLVH